MRIKLPRTRKQILAWVLILLTVALPASYAFSLLFTQTVPQELLPSQDIASNCASLVLNSTIATTSGNMLFSCTNQSITTLTAGAFQTVSTGVVFPAAAIPVFKLGAFYTGIWLVTSAGNCPALSTPTGTQLINGTAIKFLTAGVGYDYCVSYSGGFGQTAGQFNIAWYN